MDSPSIRQLTLLIILLIEIVVVQPESAWAQQHIVIGSPTASQSSTALPIDESHVRESERLLGSTFRRTESKHFIILSDCDRDWTLARAGLLERTYHQFLRIARRLDADVRAPDHKLLCVLINDHDAYEVFAANHDNVQAEWVAGYYASESNRMVFYNDETGPAYQQALSQLDEYRDLERDARTRARAEHNAQMAERLDEHADLISAHLTAEQSRLGAEVVSASMSKTIHEAVHMIAFNVGLQSRSHEYPFWLSEGLATTFETSDSRAAFGPDHCSVHRESRFGTLLQEDRVMPLAELISANQVPNHAAQIAEVMYLQSYALFRFLFRYERDHLSRFFRLIAAETPGRINSARQRDLFEQAFGPIDELEQRWLKHERTQLQRSDG